MTNIIELGQERSRRSDEVTRLGEEILKNPDMREHLDWFLQHYYGHVDPDRRRVEGLPIVTQMRYGECLVYPQERCAHFDPRRGDVVYIRDIQPSQMWREGLTDNPEGYNWNPAKILEAGKNTYMLNLNLRTGERSVAGIIGREDFVVDGEGDQWLTRLTVAPNPDSYCSQPFAPLEARGFPHFEIDSRDGVVTAGWDGGSALKPIGELLRVCYPERFSQIESQTAQVA